jgi:hypothetical protein
MKRREFILAFAGSAAAAAWPLAARAQQGERVRRVGVLMPHVQNNSVALARIAALTQELQRLGWNAGRNLAIDVRFPAPSPPAFANRRPSWRRPPPTSSLRTAAWRSDRCWK